jgi:predicted nucleic acid-binding protein
MFLDTNFLIAGTRAGTPAALQVERWIIQGEPLHASAMAWAEYLSGPLLPTEEQASRAILHRIHPVDEATAILGARLFNGTGRRARSLPDCLIAATAMLARQPLATLNTADFRPFIPFGLVLAGN